MTPPEGLGHESLDPDLPVFSGRAARQQLTRCWGLPNSAPRVDEGPFSRCRVLFVDDSNDGRPIAYWIPEEEPIMKTVNADARILGFSVDETADVTKIRVPFERGEVVVTLSTADQVGPLIRALSKCGDPADVD